MPILPSLAESMGGGAENAEPVRIGNVFPEPIPLGPRVRSCTCGDRCAGSVQPTHCRMWTMGAEAIGPRLTVQRFSDLIHAALMAIDS